MKLHPELLGKHQQFVSQKLGGSDPKPVFFVFHGGSGSTKDEYREAISHGVVKVNVDTDLQWGYLTGIRDYVLSNVEYLKVSNFPLTILDCKVANKISPPQSQVGNPEGPNKPNKKKYDPRVWVREGEKTMKARVEEALKDFNASGSL